MVMFLTIAAFKNRMQIFMVMLLIVLIEAMLVVMIMWSCDDLCVPGDGKCLGTEYITSCKAKTYWFVDVMKEEDVEKSMK